MIRSIQIKNYALIEDAHIELSEGLNVITGETGAGKSLFLSAISLILGEKADLKLIKNKDKETSVMIEINPSKHPQLISFLKESDLDIDSFILKRKFSQDNSRCFINDQLVSLNKVKELMKDLVHICSQNESSQIADASEQLFIIDSFSKNEALLELKQVWEERRNVLAEISKLKEISKSVDFNLDFVSFQLEDINKLGLSKDDLNLDTKIEGLKKQEELSEIASELSLTVLDGDNSIKNQIKNLIYYAQKLKNNFGLSIDLDQINKIKSDLYEFIDSIKIEKFDQEDIVFLKNRVEALKPLLRKHGPTVQDLLNKKNVLEEQLKKIKDFDNNLNDLESNLNKINKKALAISQKISKNRLKIIPEIEKKVSSQLQDLNMKGAEFRINLIPDQELSQSGTDKIEFLIKPHAGQQPMPLAKIASGGEISRIVLALNSVINTSGFFLFDEIDSGIGGNTGLSIGQKLKVMGKKNQIICITHLHQVAVYGDNHFKIDKIQEKNKTTTKIIFLNDDNKVNEIARMLGDDLSSKTKDHARELIRNAQKKA